MKHTEKFGLDRVLAEIKAGLNPAKICEKYKIPKQTLGYYTSRLIKLGCIEKSKGYAQWKFIKEVPILPKVTIPGQHSDLSRIRGHAFRWTIEFLDHNYNWIEMIENYKKKYKNPKLRFSLILNNKVPRVIFKNRKIWLTKTGLIIYESLDFFGKSSFQVKGTAVYEMDKLIKDLLKELDQKFYAYSFICSREHFAYTKSQMARQFNDKKVKVKVEWNGKHFWIDHSDGEHEEETDDPNVSVQAQKFYEDQVKTKFEVTPSTILKGFAEQQKINGQIIENQLVFDKNMSSHLEVLNRIGNEISQVGKGNIEVIKIIGKLSEIIKRLDKK